MKSLLLMADDAISSLVWLEKAKQYLNAGRQVIAITDAENSAGLVGVGDDLPSYTPFLADHEGFRSLTLSSVEAGPAEVLSMLKEVTGDTVIMFNLSLFEWVAENPAWLGVLDTCAKLPREMVFSQYVPWYVGVEEAMEPFEREALKRIEWDYVAGCRLVTPKTISAVKALFPTLASAVEVPAGHQLQLLCNDFAGVAVWQVLNPAGTYEMRLPWSQVRKHTDAYACLWDSRYPHVTVADEDSSARVARDTPDTDNFAQLLQEALLREKAAMTAVSP